MITQAVLHVFASVAAYIFGLFPTVFFPTFLTGTGDGTLAGTIGTVVSSIDGAHAWLPGSVLVSAAALVLAASVASLAIRIVRIVASFLTLGGGSAA